MLLPIEPRSRYDYVSFFTSLTFMWKNVFHYLGDAKIHAQCEISNNTVVYKTRRKIPLGFLPHPDPTLSLGSDSSINSMACFF